MEELFLDKDGKGQYIITMDASGIMKDGGLRTMMQSMGGEEGKDNPFASEDPIEVDSLILMTAAPDSLKSRFKHPELMSKMSMRQQISESKEIMKTQFMFDFDEIGQIDKFLEDMGNMSTGGDALSGLGLGGPSALINMPTAGQALFTAGKKMLTRNKTEKGKDESELMDEQTKAMMNMMLADATYTMIYNLPGRVKKTTFPDAVIDGKTVKVTQELLDVMNQKVEQSGTIKFKKK